MPDSAKTLIMKFGGSVLQEPSSFRAVAEWVVKKKSSYRLVLVVSAIKGETDHLIRLASQVHPSPPRREYDMLVSVGERISMSLLAMALDAIGCPAISFTGSQSGVVTTADHADAQILEIRPHRIQEALGQGKVVIVAGFQGISTEKEITTLGRGGSDTTAVALATALQAESVEFYKDVGGIYPVDPKLSLDSGQPIPFLSYEEALHLVEKTGNKVIHPRALQLAATNQVLLQIRPLSCWNAEGTTVGPCHALSLGHSVL